MRLSMPTASAISTASRTPRTCTSSGLDWVLMARARCASSRNGLIMTSEITQPTTTVPPITPAQISTHPQVQFVDVALGLGQRRAEGDGGRACREGPHSGTRHRRSSCCRSRFSGRQHHARVPTP